ncbi:FAD-dependent oxidoreductase [Microbacterium sp. LTA6]|uniref:flavin monoamine oxidase family protein n=1 Tax=unclassified Microbacterium TaxID=2609290 RepID=UPI00313A3CF3
MTRRTLLAGAGAGALSVLLASCTPGPDPTPGPTKTTAPTPGPTPSNGVPLPTGVVRSAWSTDPFARGAASYMPVGAQPGVRETLAGPVGGRIFFAGEATSADAPGTMRGALRSGQRAAAELLEVGGGGERIAVIGAGLAGAGAAARLRDVGLDVTVLEARPRVGGRVESWSDDAWPVPVQFGGWLLDGADTNLRGDLEASGIPIADLVPAGWFSAEGEIEPVEVQPVRSALDAASSLLADVPLADALSEAGVDPADPGIAALLAFVAATSGADAAEVSAWFPPALISGDLAAPTGDVSALFDGLLDGSQVRLSSPVSHVAYDDTGVSLRLGTGESLSFDRVIVTVPLGVLQQQAIEFDPALPLAHRGAITALAMGHIETVWLQFEEPFWDAEASIWHVVGGEATIRTWINLFPTTGEAVLVGIVGGAAAQEFAALKPDEAIAAAAESLGSFVRADSP